MSLKTEKKLLKGFKVLKVKYSNESTSTHEVFIKEHCVRNQSEETPIGRTLFAINIPPWATQDSLLKAFSKAGDVEKVIFCKLNKDDKNLDGFKSAYIVFEKPVSLFKALKLKSLPSLSTTEFPIVTGLHKWAQQYNETMVLMEERKEAAIKLIEKYDVQEKKRLEDEKRNANGDDEWTLVTRDRGVARKESVINKIINKSNKKEKTLKNFYRHQIREAKKDQLAELRKKAEEDKKKILILKQRRAFKPF